MNIEPVVIITGASRGIGRRLALDCARYGMAVAVNYRSDETATAAVVEEIQAAGGRACAVRADVSDEYQARRLVDACVDQFGRLDCVINNAGAALVRTLDELDGATFQQTLNANLLSAFHVSQAAIPHLRQKGGRLIFMSSGAARIGGRVSAAYAASKAGMEGLMRYYALYLRDDRITANAIAPLLIETDMLAGMELPPPSDLPLGRPGRPDEVWPAVRMIIETEYLTGQTIHLNAGRYMT
ncbi:MAG: SDR family NAD(P)-dependent oxidoreductase [Methylocystis sp.]|jgi:3-oxoacyl-[acyl-carrier protein] reductase